ncbi:DUF3644 domain-containing protein [Arthrobacter sp. ZGTC412]|uniref:DUF3644 domain-containing protein n=1 Tax=Arthrobacter sp. ZGTC412 TaxID=2058900 RepID=UPI0035A12C54
MAPRPTWWHMLPASKAEARLAVDLYNRSGNERQLEAFIVHMNLAWTKLLQARVDATGGSSLKETRGAGERSIPRAATFSRLFV